MDMNGDGRITASDFMMAGGNAYGAPGAIAGALAFKVLDRNGDGQLSGGEAFGMFNNVGYGQQQQYPQMHYQQQGYGAMQSYAMPQYGAYGPRYY